MLKFTLHKLFQKDISVAREKKSVHSNVICSIERPSQYIRASNNMTKHITIRRTMLASLHKLVASRQLPVTSTSLRQTLVASLLGPTQSSWLHDKNDTLRPRLFFIRQQLQLLTNVLDVLHRLYDKLTSQVDT